ncbi:MAG TPA: hypothetical protein VGJ91_04900 [Polyangiaceae bacterium]
MIVIGAAGIGTRAAVGIGTRAAALTFCALAATAPACSSDSGHPSLVSAAGQPANGGRAGASPAEEGGSPDLAGASGDEAGDSGAAGSAAGSGGAPIELGGSGGKPPTTPAACDPHAAWSAAASVSGVSSGASETLLALTPDELDLAFLRDGALYVAHRSSAGAAFSSGSALVIPTGWSAAHGASLSADGKRLLLVSADQKSLGEWTRSSRESAFSAAVDSGAFAAINQDSDFSGRVYASPTVSAGDDQLFFNSSFLDADSTIVVSSRAGTGNWSAPRTLSPGSFDGSEGKRRLPTGVSVDGRTLFYFNEESGQEEAQWRATSSVSSPLSDMLSLGMRRGAAPNSACNRLYSESNSDVVVEKD